VGLVFLPLAPAQLRAWAGGGGTLAGRHRGYGVTPAMTRAFGLTDPEDAEYTALCIASIAGLLDHGVRLVAVLEAPLPDIADEFGEVALDDPRFADVTSLFGEDVDPAPARAAGAGIRGLSLAQAWDAPAVESLLAGTDLLWYGPGEWAVLAG
jgi:hypothetical protein